MIGSFWNLCRACPSMPVDKLHSEYRSTYRWHEYTGPRQEVVRRPPQSAAAGAPTAAPSAATAMTAAAGATSSRAVPNRAAEEDTGDGGIAAPRFEPALPRRKKHPELAYRTHEFLAMSDVIGSDDSLDSTVTFDRARSEERAGERIRTSRRSKSEGPRHEYRLHYMKEVASPPTKRVKKLRSGSDPCDEQMMIASYPPSAPVPVRDSGPPHAKPRTSTEYRLQFAWPRGRSGSSRGRAAAGTSTTRAEEVRTTAAVPRKSLSMGAIRPTTAHGGPAAVHSHRKRNVDYNRAPDEGTTELDILVAIETSFDGPTTLEADQLRGEEKIQNENLSKEDKPRRRKEFKTEYKKKFRPFSQYDYVEGKFQKKKDHEDMNLPLVLPDMSRSDSWYREVLELRKKAGEYKHRGWGTELVPQHIAELYSKQMTLWEQVSRRSSLSALSLASTTPRAITKEEKEKENNKKSSPTKPMHRPAFTRPATAQDKTLSEKKKEKSSDEKDGKKEGPRSRKEFLVRHHLDRTTGSMDGALLPSPTREKLEPVIPRQKEEDLPKSPQKASPKSSPRTARSQSVGPGISAAGDRRSPKRQPRAPSAAPSTAPSKAAAPKPAAAPKAAAAAAAAVPVPAVAVPPVLPVERRPRPSGGEDGTDSEQAESEEVELLVHAAAQEPAAMIKSPPEPTRVKSPEQILMRSPEPVNWTVPLDTGKTFTVTQNVRQAIPSVKINRGEFTNRPHSEVKAWTPPAVPPPAPQSAPPQLPEDWKSPASNPPLETFPVINGLDEKHEQKPTPSLPQTKSVAGTTLRCLEDPSTQHGGYRVLEAPIIPSDIPIQPSSEPQGPYRVLEAPSMSPVDPSKPLPLVSPTSSTNRSMASDVLEKARTRFDNFWGKSKDDKEGSV